MLALASSTAKAAPTDEKGAIVMPQVLHFEPAVYSAAAEKKGIEGEIVLELDISKGGVVTRATVVQPLEPSLDDAAVAAASKLTFAPARRGGIAIPARILYRYNFHLTPIATDAAESNAPKLVQNFRGKVRAATAELALIGSSVTVRPVAAGHERPDEGAASRAIAGDDGGFAFENLAAGKYVVRVEAAGYEALQVEEELVLDATTEVTYRLAPKGGEHEVTIRGARPPREAVRRTIEQRELLRIPGTNGDAIRSLLNLPGVARPPGLAGLLIVRGSAPQDTATFVDGIYIPLIYHFGGISSVIPSEMLEKIDFYPGNFSAQYGRQMGGIVDVSIRAPNPDGHYHAMGQVDLIDARVVAEGPVPVVKGWSFILGGRRSWVDTWLKPVLEAAKAGVTSAPVYYDYQAFVQTNPTPRSTFRVGIFGSSDRFEILIKDPSAQDPALGGNLNLSSAFWRLVASYRNDINDDIRFTSALSYGGDANSFGLGSLYFNIRTYPVVNRTELSTRIATGVTLHTGLDLAVVPYNVDLKLPPPPRPGEPSAGPFSTLKAVPFSSDDTVFRPAMYVEAEIAPERRLKIIPGARADYARDTGRWDLSPRINVRYAVEPDFPRTTLKSSVGVFAQPPQIQETTDRLGTPGLHSNRAIHYSLGAEQDLTRHLEVSIETFYKDLDRLVARLPDEQNRFVYNNLGRGSVIGGEVLLKYKPDARFFGWLAYTLSRSTRQNPPAYTEVLFQYDQTHMLTALGSYQLGHGWEFGARFRLFSGNLVTPYVGGITATDAGAYAGVSGAPFSQRLAMFHQLDLRIDKQWKYSDNSSFRVYLDVQNVYNRANPEGRSYNYNFSLSTVQSGLPLIPSIGIRGEF